MKATTFQAITVGQSIIAPNRKVELQDTGNGFYLIVRAETDKGRMAKTTPMTLFLRAGEFARHLVAERGTR